MKRNSAGKSRLISETYDMNAKQVVSNKDRNRVLEGICIEDSQMEDLIKLLIMEKDAVYARGVRQIN